MNRLQKARLKAQQVLQENNINGPYVDVFDLAQKYASVIEQELSDEVSGVFIPKGDRKYIVVNRNHPPVRKRFTVAHELGHALLHEYSTAHADKKFRFRDARSSEGSALEEIEANQFAAELLMPRKWIVKDIEQCPFELEQSDEHDDNFDTWVAELARNYDVSKQAMRIRLVSVMFT